MISVVSSSADPRFDAAMAIYMQAIEPSEQKPAALLRQNLDDDRYTFLIAETSSGVTGFAIVFVPQSRDFWLLEYMAVAADSRSSGVGSQLFLAAVELAGRLAPKAPGILEVDAPTAQHPATGVVGRRLAFYARNGCRAVEGLRYILPLDGKQPPPMQLLMHAQPPLSALATEKLKAWLSTLYCEVYGQAADDPRIVGMTSHFGDMIPIGEIPS